jgi:hypothetical protein
MDPQLPPIGSDVAVRKQDFYLLKSMKARRRDLRLLFG